MLAKGELRVLLGLDPGRALTLAGELRNPADAGALCPAGTVAEARPDVRALEAEVQEAEGEIAMGKGMRWPEVTPRVRFEREAGPTSSGAG